MLQKNNRQSNKKLRIIILINILIFLICNIFFTITYEEVDDFYIYNLYSGLDGTYNIHGIYIHPLLCLVIGVLYRIAPIINWHSIFLLTMQFICFTLIGYTIYKKHDSVLYLILYTAFASLFYTTLLMLIQYTSVAGLLILTSFILLIDLLETQEQKSKFYKISILILYALGIMLRNKSLYIILPYMAVYYLYYLIKFLQKKSSKENIIKLTKYYICYILITLAIILSHNVYYNSNPVYKNHTEYNKMRTYLHDLSSVSYYNNKEIFDEIGWSKNDYSIFYTYDFGDENKYCKENIQKIYDYAIEKDVQKDFNILAILKSFISNIIINNLYAFILLTSIFIYSLLNEKCMKKNICIFVLTIAIDLLFNIMDRYVLRVIIPAYILGTALIIYNLRISNKNQNELKKIENKNFIKLLFLSVIIIAICFSVGIGYKNGYNLKDYSNYQELINYTNQHKQNAYLCTVPSLQDRYLAYTVYQMPPKNSFSNLRIIGGWDMYTQNYYDFKNRYNLEGNMLDLLKDNVYLIDGDVTWRRQGIKYENYKEKIAIFIEENYNKKVKFEEIKTFDNLKIYKVTLEK